MHEGLFNRFGGLSLPRESVARLTDRPDMTLDVYRGRKTTMQQQQQPMLGILIKRPSNFYCWPSQGGSSVLVLLVILDVARCYLWLFTLYINIKIGKNSR